MDSLVKHKTIIQVAQQLYKTIQMRKQYALQEAELLQQLRSLTNDNEFSMHGYKFRKIVRKGCIDYKRIPGMQFVNLDTFRKPQTTFWKLEYTGLN